MSDEMSAEPVAMNPLQAIRTIRACESEAAAQLRLEHYASVVRAMAIADIARHKALIEKAVKVLGRQLLPDGISDHEALNELHGIFDGPEYRALSSPPSVSEEWIAKIINSIPGGVNSEDCYSVVRATLAALGVTVEGAAK